MAIVVVLWDFVGISVVHLGKFKLLQLLFSSLFQLCGIWVEPYIGLRHDPKIGILFFDKF